ncbi:MAG TPA: hypothetical protein VEK08_14200, partial [Planctomycetota bacterium]|nr:hypothetical protein [Planctomycetota bacterium]
FALRLFPLNGAMPGVERLLVQAALLLPLLAAGAVALYAYADERYARADEVALLLDRRADSKEHLATWLHYRTAADSILPAQQPFLQAQLSATLSIAPSIKPAELLPLRLPDWSRALWLAILLLCCALLMPPATQAVSNATLQRAAAKIAAASREEPLLSGGAPADNRQTPRVQVLPPTELWKFQLMISDPELSPELKAQALKELQQKIGNIPESELTPEVREILSALRPASSDKPNGSEDSKPGTSQTKGDSKEADKERSVQVGSAAAVGTFNERAFSSIQQQYPDVKDKLEKYYRSSNQPEERKELHVQP